MGNIMVRMGIVIGILATVQLGFLFVGRMGHPAVVDPQRPIEAFPMTFTAQGGKWEGKEAALDTRSFNNAQVDKAVSRIYTKEGNRTLSFLLAQYTQPSVAVYHSPMNCYRSNGFTQVGEVEFLPLRTSNNSRPDTQISVTTWQGDHEKIVVAFWYEIGDISLYERKDLWSTYWAMFGKDKWPVTFKVLLEMPANDPEQTKAEIVNFAQYVREWLGDAKPKVD